MKTKKILLVVAGLLLTGAVVLISLSSGGSLLKGDLGALSGDRLIFLLSNDVKSGTYSSGQNNVPLFAFQIGMESNAEKRITRLAFRGFIDCDENGVFSHLDTVAPGTSERFCPNGESVSNFSTTVRNMALYLGNEKVSDVVQASVDHNDFAWIIFDHLTSSAFRFYGNNLRTFTLRGDIAASAPSGFLNDRIKIGLLQTNDVTVQDSAGRQLDPLTIDFFQLPSGYGDVTNQADQDNGIRMTIKRSPDLSGNSGSTSSSPFSGTSSTSPQNPNPQANGPWAPIQVFPRSTPSSMTPIQPPSSLTPSTPPPVPSSLTPSSPSPAPGSMTPSTPPPVPSSMTPVTPPPSGSPVTPPSQAPANPASPDPVPSSSPNP